VYSTVGGGLLLLNVVLLGLLSGLSGCHLAELVEPENIILSEATDYEPTDLSARSLEERMVQIDELYVEPRTTAKVNFSLETSLASVSQVNQYEALWRAARACAWLAQNADTRRDREEYARRGVRLGSEARRRTSHRVEAFYYLSLCQIRLDQVAVGFQRRQGREAENNLKIAVTLDASFDQCGPQRELAQLLLAAHDARQHGAKRDKGWASLQGALKHAGLATDGCPDYAGNQLVAAKVFEASGDYAMARASVENVLGAQRLPDYSAEHEHSLNEANEMLITLQGK